MASFRLVVQVPAGGAGACRWSLQLLVCTLSWMPGCPTPPPASPRVSSGDSHRHLGQPVLTERLIFSQTCWSSNLPKLPLKATSSCKCCHVLKPGHQPCVPPFLPSHVLSVLESCSLCFKTPSTVGAFLPCTARPPGQATIVSCLGCQISSSVVSLQWVLNTAAK